jgi:hypothetical protein
MGVFLKPVCLAHDLVQKPVPTFWDHAEIPRDLMVLGRYQAVSETIVNLPASMTNIPALPWAYQPTL